VGLVSPFGAAAVAMLGLLLGIWLVSVAADHKSPWSARPGRSLLAGWALIVLASMLLLLAVPTAAETAPSPRRTAPNSGPAGSSPRAPVTPATPRPPG
jgi:hypothetical protein